MFNLIRNTIALLFFAAALPANAAIKVLATTSDWGALVTEIGPFRATAITYVNPAVAILAGAIFLSEEITQWTILGFVLVLSGSYLVTKRRREVADEVAPAAAAGPESAVASETRPTTEAPESHRT